MALPWWFPFGGVPDVSATELFTELGGPVTPQLVDVRTASEWAGGHIDGALNVPVTKLARRLASLQLDAARPVVAVCLSAHRSVPAVRLLKDRGFASVRQLRGGMLAWRRANLPERPGGNGMSRRRKA